MTGVFVFCFLSILLVAGKILRVKIPLLQNLYLPSSVIGGLIGLMIFSCFPDLIPHEIAEVVKKMPGFLINVVFATLFLGVSVPPMHNFFKLVLPQVCFGQVMAWGQYVIGLSLTFLLLLPVFNVHPAFGNLLEIGFEGGHGTVGGMSSTMVNANWEEGISLGMAVATFGMILGVVIGMILINYAARHGYFAEIRCGSGKDRKGIFLLEDRPHAGYQTVASFSIDSLAWHVALIGIAISLGYLGLWGVKQFLLSFGAPRLTALGNGFPLFPLCMIGGILLQKFMTVTKTGHLISHGQMLRLSGASLDFLVLSALASIQLKTVVSNWQPLLLLILGGLLWNIFMVLVIAPRMFKQAWFERAIAEFGQSCGVTATGLLLLRTVDPENKTCAGEAFGYKQLFHEPIMGGGLWTVAAFLLIFSIGLLPVLLISVGGLAVWLIVWAFCRKRWMN